MIGPLLLRLRRITQLKSELYKQCVLERFNGKHYDKQTAWIPCKGLRPGMAVELIGDTSKEPWTIMEMYKHTMTEEEVKAQGDKARAGSWSKLANI